MVFFQVLSFFLTVQSFHAVGKWNLNLHNSQQYLKLKVFSRFLHGFFQFRVFTRFLLQKAEYLEDTVPQNFSY